METCTRSVLKEEATESERRELTAKNIDLEKTLDAMKLEQGRMQAEVRALEKQRDQHCAHSEILLKEKNRLTGELMRMRRPLSAAAHSPDTAAEKATFTTPPPNIKTAIRAQPYSPDEVPMTRTPVHHRKPMTSVSTKSYNNILTGAAARPSSFANEAAASPAANRVTILERKRQLDEARKAALSRAACRPLSASGAGAWAS